MNETDCRYSKCISIVVLAGAFLISSEMPLWARSPQQSDTSAQQSNTAAQKQGNSLPDAPQAQTSQSQETAAVPSGAAGAKAPNVKGAPVAQPAGAAVAPPRQR